jgi:UMF1 family MFS transporter
MMTTQPSTQRSFLLSRNLIGWFLYDVGASAFATSVITVFFGPHITRMARAAADSEGFVHPLGIQTHAGAFYPIIITLSVILQVCLLPVLGALADYSRTKKQWLSAAALAGAASVAAVYIAGESDYLMAGTLFVAANVAFGAADVFYNSFLPAICTPEQRNTVSSTGWGLAYLGGGILLVVQYVFLSQSAEMGFSADEASRLCLLVSAVWWAGFATAAVLLMRVDGHHPKPKRQSSVLAAIPQLVATLRHLRKSPHTLLFLIAFLVYSDGIQTVTSISTQFGQEEIGLTVDQLAEVILIVQFVGFMGAFVFNVIVKKLGSKYTIMLALVIYSVIMVYVYGVLSTVTEFYIMAACIALVLVGSQAMSRSAFSRMIPRGREAEYFGIYEISERGTSWLGPLMFGLALQFTDSYRIAVLALAVFFVVGLALLTRVNFSRAMAEAQMEDLADSVTSPGILTAP